MLSLIVVIFVLGYVAIALELPLKINKTATALLTGASCWALYAVSASSLLPLEKIPRHIHEEAIAGGFSPALHYLIEGQLLQITGETAGVLFFLMGAMVIVELIDANEGFSIITSRIRSRNKVSLLWIIAWTTFFLSSVLDNLVTTIVMVSFLRKIVSDQRDRMLFAGLIVIAANAGGAWTVIGDVTTTMLWIKHKISTIPVMRDLFLASFTCLLVPLVGMSFLVRGTFPDNPTPQKTEAHSVSARMSTLILILGMGGLLSVPIFKAVTHLPPFMGVIFAVAILWIVTELIHANSDQDIKSSTGLVQILRRIDMSSVLFFLGILLAVGCLGAVGVLQQLANQLDAWTTNKNIIGVVIGFVSAIGGNVPLVASGIEMYDDPMDSPFWMLLAYCAGTGGSCLVIGSAAGVAAMGLEKIDFVWYMRNISLWAVLGYLSGVGVFFLQARLLG